MLDIQDGESEPQVRIPAMLGRMFHVARAVHPGPSPRALWFATRLFALQVAQGRSLRAWYGGGNAALQDMLAWRPSLISAVNRPYISAEWGASRRLAAIEEHYRQLAGHARTLRVAPDARVRMAAVRARASSVEILLDSPAWFVHEGELSLNLFSEGERVYTLAFTLGLDKGKAVAYVGALQGLGTGRALGLYRKLTHAMHGLRPRDLLLTAFRVLCKEVGAHRILAVSDSQRVSQSPYFRGGTRVHSSYDTVWAEHRGALRQDGFFELPVEVARRSRDSIPTRKRSEYRQRYEMLDQLNTDMALAMHARGEP